MSFNINNSSVCDVAVIMSVYRSDDPTFLKDAIDSVLNQTVPCKVFLCRDGIVDSPLQKVIDQYLEYEMVVGLLLDENKGLASSLNSLIDLVVKEEFKYVARMDSDDISRNERFFKQIKFLQENPDISVCGTFCREFGATYALEKKGLPVAHTELIDFSIYRCPFIHPSVMFKMDIFKKGYRYPTNTKLTEDMALWFELLVDGFKFGNVNEVLLDYRLTENTIERRKGVSKAWSEFFIRSRYMFKLRMVTLNNIAKITSRLIFHILPSSLVKLAYKKLR